MSPSWWQITGPCQRRSFIYITELFSMLCHEKYPDGLWNYTLILTFWITYFVLSTGLIYCVLSCCQLLRYGLDCVIILQNLSAPADSFYCHKLAVFHHNSVWSTSAKKYTYCISNFITITFSATALLELPVLKPQQGQPFPCNSCPHMKGLQQGAQQQGMTLIRHIDEKGGHGAELS